MEGKETDRYHVNALYRIAEDSLVISAPANYRVTRLTKHRFVGTNSRKTHIRRGREKKDSRPGYFVNGIVKIARIRKSVAEGIWLSSAVDPLNEKRKARQGAARLLEVEKTRKREIASVRHDLCSPEGRVSLAIGRTVSFLWSCISIFIEFAISVPSTFEATRLANVSLQLKARDGILRLVLRLDCYVQSSCRLDGDIGSWNSKTLMSDTHQVLRPLFKDECIFGKHSSRQVRRHNIAARNRSEVTIWLIHKLVSAYEHIEKPVWLNRTKPLFVYEQTNFLDGQTDFWSMQRWSEDETEFLLLRQIKIYLSRIIGSSVYIVFCFVDTFQRCMYVF